MESSNKNSLSNSPSYPRKPPMPSKPFTMISKLPTLTLPNAQNEKMRAKPYSPIYGKAGGSVSKPCPEPVNGLNPPPSPDDKNMKSPRSDMDASKGGDGVAIASPPSNGGITIKTKPATDLENLALSDPDMDERKLRRILSNRISAQKSRLKKIQYINEMENKARDLQAAIAVMSPRVANQHRHNNVLRMEKIVLKQKIDECEDKSKISYVEIVENQAEAKRLKDDMRKKQQEPMMPGWNQSGLDQTANMGSFQPVGPQQVVGFDPNLNGLDPFIHFNSLTIDPPDSLM